jgi:hypothetical protein
MDVFTVFGGGFRQHRKTKTKESPLADTPAGFGFPDSVSKPFNDEKKASPRGKSGHT